MIYAMEKVHFNFSYNVINHTQIESFQYFQT